MSKLLTLAAIVVRAQEAWEPVLLGGLIPVVGAVAILWIIIRAVRDNPENDDNPDNDS
ncbi:MAG: hypothetical protein H0X42_07915 [Solirubrobacterales bacterium]|nr:hypothetical protein [Solirubrobacterales bacterium]